MRRRTIWGPWERLTRSQLRTILFEYIEVFSNRQRHQARLGHRTPAEIYPAAKAACLTTTRDPGSTPETYTGGRSSILPAF